MPNFWQFPTVSMGLGPIMGIYQARYMRYLQNRDLIPESDRKVWVFLGDGEMDEPESRGALSLAGREKLDNLIFVVNCNLQRLDGPVRGNGKIIQELEGEFLGAGWNVIKVIWGGYWDSLLMRDKDDLLKTRMEDAVDGEYQAFKANDGSFVRENFFGKHPKLKEMVANISDEDIWRLNRGGHDPHKVYAAYHKATTHKGQPTVILAKTVKGYGMGLAGEGLNTTHQQKKLKGDDLLAFRDRFNIPLTDDEVINAPFYRPAEDSVETQYLLERRRELGGFIPSRRSFSAPSFKIPKQNFFQNHLKSTGDREASTTMVFVRILSTLMRDPQIKPHIVPIIPDESRTFGMEGMFQQLGIYAPDGQLYEPVDSKQLLSYREDKKGQVLQEGINESGAMSSWIAAGTSFSNHYVHSIPFFILYSMFGFQRVGDLCWAAGDSRTRGFILGATAGRTTLAGEGLQHQDGHSLVLASTVPNCISYDPTYSYELALIIQSGMERMYQNKEAVYFYITLMNENYKHPQLPDGVEEGVLRGMYLLKSVGDAKNSIRVQLLGSGTILREVEKAAELLNTKYQVSSDVWSVTSFNELARDGQKIERENRLHPDKKQKKTYVQQSLEKTDGPIVAATDYIRLYGEQIRAYLPKNRNYHVLGTDGYGRSDTRQELRRFFEVDHKNITYAALYALSQDGLYDTKNLKQSIQDLEINTEAPIPSAR